MAPANLARSAAVWCVMAMGVGAGRPTVTRRAVLTTAALASALPAGAENFATRADLAISSLRDADSAADATSAIRALGALAEEYDGLADRTGETVRTLLLLKKSPLWSEALEGEYRDAMRSIDPFRVNAVTPAFRTSIFIYAPVYVGLLVLQQQAPKFFFPAYLVGALITLGPIALAIANS